MNVKRHALTLAVVVLVSTAVPVLGASPSAEFDGNVAETPAGETAEIPVTLSETDNATVTVGSESVNYVATVVVGDGNGDRNVTLRYNTSKAGHGGAFSVADGADNVTVVDETELSDDHLLAPGSYELTVAPGNRSGANATDVAALVVGEPESDEDPETETATPGPYAGHVTDIEGGVVVAHAQNQTITGSLDLEPGTEVQVRVQGDQFIRTATTNVTDDGRFRVSFDFDDSVGENGTEFTVSVRANDETQTEVMGVVRTPPTETTETTKQAVQDETTETTTDSQDGSTPGFGLSTAVLALTAVALLALRRDD
ncbi:BGTF surface domain-containing protein [Halorussus caseinilyticus]|uniref:BGTF surface domain-containing protein n=1 Tax=Halorussus caseinilyticus TaxID=3034025 RepID=A0ABD5WPW4_9EURY|nr:BGTF surface domain-containing protein [Halorussus sp. DT72]